MRITDRRLYQAANREDFIFRFYWREDDNRHRRNAMREQVFYTAAAFVAPDITKIFGTDWSDWDGEVNPKPFRDYGGKFSIVKAIDGTVPMRYWRGNLQRARDAGLAATTYAWLYPDSRVNCTLQAKAYWELLKTQKLDLPPVVDFEWTRYSGVSANPNYDDLNKWVTAFTNVSGVKPILYSAAGYMNMFGTMPLWLRAKFAGFWWASYGGTQPSYPKGFSDWDLWQFTANGDAMTLCPGTTGKKELDLNYMTEAFYQRHVGGETTLPPPATGETMYKVRSDFYSMTLRPDHNTGALGTESVPAGIEMLADEIWTATADLYKLINGVNTKVNAVGDKWAHVVSVAGVAKNSWVAIIHKGVTYCNSVQVINDAPTVTLKHTIKIYSDGSYQVDNGSVIP